MSQFFKTKEATQAWLDEMGVEGYTIHDDLKVDVDGNVWVCDKGLTHFPVRFGSVSGCFDCSENQITSLEGAPHYIGGNFICARNPIALIERAPVVAGSWIFFKKRRTPDQLAFHRELARRMETSNHYFEITESKNCNDVLNYLKATDYYLLKAIE